MPFGGSPRRARPGVICPSASANGTACFNASIAGASRECFRPSWRTCKIPTSTFCCWIPRLSVLISMRPARRTLLECFEVPQKLLTQLQPDTGWIYEDDASWEARLDAWKITSAEQRRLVTEGALWANLLAQGLYNDLVLISDDAAQFKLLAFLHALCWVHMERHVARLIPLTADQHAAHDAARDAIWNYYQRLKAYRESPTPQWRGRLENEHLSFHRNLTFALSLVQVSHFFG